MEKGRNDSQERTTGNQTLDSVEKTTHLDRRIRARGPRLFIQRGGGKREMNSKREGRRRDGEGERKVEFCWAIRF